MLYEVITLTPEKYAAQCKEFCNDVFKLRPETNIWFIATKPSVSRWKTQPKYSKANELIKKYCDSDPRLHYIDIVTRNNFV